MSREPYDFDPPRFSIAKRLSAKLSRRLILTFISLDIIIVLLVALATVTWCEWETANMGTEQYTEVGYAMGRNVGDVLRIVLPERTRNGSRDIQTAWIGFVPLPSDYNIYFYENGVIYCSAHEILPMSVLTLFAMGILVVVEIIILIKRSRSNSKIVRKMLAPISDFASAAESIGHITDSLRPDEIAELRGALDGITAARLDTRLDVDSSQRELRDLALAINGMLDRVSEAYAAQIRFVSDASHELRTPISVIQGYAGLLDRWGKNDPKTLQEGIDAIKFESESMRGLVERLLFLARGDSGTLQLDAQPFDLSELITESGEEFRLIDETHEFAVEADTAPVFADRAQIKEALRVLIDNAMKYTDAGGVITLRSGKHETGEAYLSVTDTGCGIAPEDLPRIFERFVRTDTSRARASGGSGLGLAIARKIVSASGGRIEATSRVGIGTRMTIVLPTTINSLDVGAGFTRPF
ncbi:MAG: HAMP domain-containing histidine kinase [Oscillospiraceae bacterium]|jgi:signal transduction histidine kinase|nr:HAMP domain-containing histidine kinase [Oscillospiraceae bacterium]